MKRRTTLLAIREMQIKTTLRYHLTPVRMDIINKSTTTTKQMLVCLWRKANLSTLLVGMQTSINPVENSMEFPQKTQNGTAF